jgi:hypothetical protein
MTESQAVLRTVAMQERETLRQLWDTYGRPERPDLHIPTWSGRAAMLMMIERTLESSSTVEEAHEAAINEDIERECDSAFQAMCDETGWPS